MFLDYLKVAIFWAVAGTLIWFFPWWMLAFWCLFTIGVEITYQRQYNEGLQKAAVAIITAPVRYLALLAFLSISGGRRLL
jgi:hypothetical protein